ncbi:MAG: hypothetical protein MK135_03715 [Polyangiaceae bacterium]|nr:hypothetical protein [Polyangiaceae bacterium]
MFGWSVAGCSSLKLVFALQLGVLLLAQPEHAWAESPAEPPLKSAATEGPPQASSAESAFQRARGSTLPRGVWALQWSVGIGFLEDDLQRNRNDQVYFYGNILPTVRVGVTDRLEVGVWDPGIAWRWGARGSSEWIPFLTSGPVGLGYSSLEGFLLQLEPRIGWQTRHWLGAATALSWQVAAASDLNWRSNRFCGPSSSGVPLDECQNLQAFQNLKLEFGWGMVFERGPWVFAPFVQVTPEWQEGQGRRAPLVELFSGHWQGLRHLPLVRYQFTPVFGFGGSPVFSLRTDGSEWTAGGYVDAQFTW